jgi:alanyl-tRNA synthetase
MTDLLYYKNAYQVDFEAKVLSIDQLKDRFAIVLDATCFYPEGGGQPADAGWLNDVRVVDVQSKNGKVIHYTEKPVKGETVRGKIDWEKRFDFMQQHTGQHLLSQSLVRVGKYRTVSVHLGESYTSVEIDASQISDQEIYSVEKMANDAINNNLPVNTHWVDPSEVHRYHLRKPPPKVEKVRVVEIKGFDASSCGGTHVSHIGEVGIIKIIGQERIRGHVRLLAKIGKRALDDYDKKIRLIQELNRMLSCGDDDIPARVNDLENEVRDLSRELARVQGELMETAAEKAARNARHIAGIEFISSIFEDLNKKAMKAFLDVLLARENRIVLIINKNNQQLNWMIGHSLKGELNLNPLVKPLLPLISGRGGGQSELIQGGGSNQKGILEFIKEFEKKIEKELKKNE